MTSPIEFRSLTSTELALLVAADRSDNDDGSPYFFDASAAEWRFELIEPAMLGAFESTTQARSWIEAEIQMFQEDGQELRADFYRQMLAEGFTEPVTVGQIGVEGRLWDGWHRTAIAIVRGELLPAIVGTPHGDRTAA